MRLRSSGGPEDPFYHGAESVDYIAHFILNKAYKTYHNQVNYFFNNENAFNPFDDGGVSEDQRYEVVSKPAIIAQLEIKLINPRRNRIFWSDLRDSSATIPYDEQLFLYNTWKYPGASHPGLIRAFFGGSNALATGELLCGAGPERVGALVRFNLTTIWSLPER